MLRCYVVINTNKFLQQSNIYDFHLLLICRILGDFLFTNSSLHIGIFPKFQIGRGGCFGWNIISSFIDGANEQLSDGYLLW
jgi:hypothetical protein